MSQQDRLKRPMPADLRHAGRTLPARRLVTEQMERKPSIGFVVSTLRRSGPTRQLLNLVSKLRSWGHEIHVLTLSAEGRDSLWDEFSTLGLNPSSLTLGRVRSVISGTSAIRRFVEEHSIDVIHTQGIRA